MPEPLQASEPSRWDTCPIVEVRLPACPSCGWTGYVRIRGVTDLDGIRTSRRVCERCSTAYVVLSYVPRCGNDEI